MPNLKSPIINSKQALKYKKILSFSKNNAFLNLYNSLFREEISITDLIWAYTNKIVFAVKLACRTTTSKGVKYFQIYKVLEAMCKHKIPLLIHGEVNDKQIDIFDREKVFIDND